MRWLGFIIAGLHSLSAGGTPFLESLERIVERDPRVAKQKAVVEEVEGRTLSDRLSLLPNVSATLSHTTTGTGDVSTTEQAASASLEVNLFRFGADFSAMGAAREEIEAARWTLLSSVLAVEQDGARALFELRAARQKIEVLERILKTRQDTLEVARLRFKRGLIANEEVSATEIDLENARAQLKDAQVDEVTAANALVALLGKAEVLPQWPWREFLREEKFIPPAGSAELLKARPDWRAAASARKAAEERQDQAWGGVFPSLDATLGYGLFRNRAGVMTMDEPRWSGAVSLTIPLFDRLANYGTYQAAVARKTQAVQEEVRVQRQAIEEWSNANQSLKISLETARSREKTLAIARKLYEANLQRFNRGLVNANELRVDQDRLYQSELFAIQGWNTAHLNYVQLCHSLGKRVRECIDGQSQPR